MPKQAEVYLDVKIRPYRSLSPKGFRNLILFVAAVLSVISFAFFLIGAWPILGFAGLDFILLYYAFKINLNEAKRVEHLRMTSKKGLEIRRITPKGEEQYTAIEPNWLQVQAIRRKGKSDAVRLRSHGKDIFIGTFLSRQACKRLAADIQDAVERYRVGDALMWSSPS